MRGHNNGPKFESYRPRLHNGRRGFVAIERAQRDHWLVGFGQQVSPMDPAVGALSRAEAWQDLIMECNYEEGTVNNGGHKMRILPGQLLGAVAWLAARWNWTPKTVRGFLDKLENEAMIKVFVPGSETGNQKGKQSSVISVCNYSEYQVLKQQQGQARGQAEGKQGASKGQAEGNIYKDNQPTIEQEEKNLLSDENRTNDGEPEKPKAKAKARVKAPTGGYSLLFEAFWKNYPDTTNNSKPAAAIEFARLDDERQAAARASLGRFAQYCRENPDYRCVHAERYLKEYRFESFSAPADNAPWWKDPAKVAAVTDERWREGIKKHANGIWRTRELGPPPGTANCVVPRHLITELKLTEIYDSHGISREQH